MEDQELEQLRQKRMAELQGAGGSQQQQHQQEEMRKQQADMKNSILAQVLTQDARSRLNTLALTKPEKAQMVENHLVQLARSGQIMGKFGEDQLKNLLEKLSEQTQKKTVVKYDRRRMAIDSDED
ncbi:programmed cell death 5 [Brachionus plicatilis]|uniref:Programmed cell death protein 5 n=1 Tax=Brachionus plicatilis TaxID=10195 RepID=A0A3M7S0I9_BRAPC|nr:programmed cell death 5 [Brachionus plicatilis]